MGEGAAQAPLAWGIIVTVGQVTDLSRPHKEKPGFLCFYIKELCLPLAAGVGIALKRKERNSGRASVCLHAHEKQVALDYLTVNEHSPEGFLKILF